MITQDEFHRELRSLLLEMEGEGQLLPFLESLGDVMAELAEELNNEVIQRIEDDRAMAADLDESE